jgi:hypothetical protein
VRYTPHPPPLSQLERGALYVPHQGEKCHKGVREIKIFNVKPSRNDGVSNPFF